MHADRVRLVLDDLPNHAHGLDAMVCNPGLDPADDAFCAWGSMCETASRHGAPLAIRRYERLPLMVSTVGNWPMSTLVAWLGTDLASMRVVAEVLPATLRAEIEPWVGEGRFAGVWPITALSDAGTPFSLIADALRVTLGVDVETVVGTPEWEAAREAQEAAEREPWGPGVAA